MITVPKELIERASEGDRAAFKEVYDMTGGYVYSVALRMTGNSEDAQEVTQDVFLKVHKNLKKFEYRSAFSTWLYRITVNTALSRIKKLHKDKPVQVDADTAFEKVRTPSALDQKIKKEDQEAKVCQIMSYLNLDQRACLLLRVIEGMDYKGIADVLEISINTVRTRLKRAREVLLNNYKKGGEGAWAARKYRTSS